MLLVSTFLGVEVTGIFSSIVDETGAVVVTTSTTGGVGSELVLAKVTGSVVTTVVEALELTTVAGVPTGQEPSEDSPFST